MRTTAFPSNRVDVGMVRAEPETAVRTNPPAVVKAIVDTGSGKKIGAGAAEEKESRQAAIAKMIKP